METGHIMENFSEEERKLNTELLTGEKLSHFSSNKVELESIIIEAGKEHFTVEVNYDNQEASVSLVDNKGNKFPLKEKEFTNFGRKHDNVKRDLSYSRDHFEAAYYISKENNGINLAIKNNNSTNNTLIHYNYLDEDNSSELRPIDEEIEPSTIAFEELLSNSKGKSFDLTDIVPNSLKITAGKADYLLLSPNDSDGDFYLKDPEDNEILLELNETIKLGRLDLLNPTKNMEISREHFSISLVVNDNNKLELLVQDLDSTNNTKVSYEVWE